jgi:vacuolar-type H+-ATPase subunit I/STV1
VIPKEPGDCNYLKEKPERDKIRVTIQDNISELKEQVKALNSYLTTQIKLSERMDNDLEKQYTSLKSMLQEAKEKQEQTDRELRDLRDHLDNGWRGGLKTDIVTELFSLLKSTYGFGLNYKTEIAKQTHESKMKSIGTIGAIITAILASPWITKWIESLI